MTFPHRKPNRLTEYDYSTPNAYFLTVCTENRKNLFWKNVGAIIVSRATWFTDCATTWFTHLLLDRPQSDKLF